MHRQDKERKHFLILSNSGVIWKIGVLNEFNDSGFIPCFKRRRATEERVSKAAEKVARYDNKLTEIKADIKLMKWMLGTILIMCTSILFKIFS